MLSILGIERFSGILILPLLGSLQRFILFSWICLTGVFQMIFSWLMQVFILSWMCCYANIIAFLEIGPALGGFMMRIRTHLSFMPLLDVGSIITLYQLSQLMGFSQRISLPSEIILSIIISTSFLESFSSWERFIYCR